MREPYDSAASHLEFQILTDIEATAASICIEGLSATSP